jgi:hypothetical protein
MASELGRLFFGRDDAELDIGEGGLLPAGFLRTSGYEAASTARKHLIIGRKGSGKSAICRTLAAENSPARATALVTPDALSATEIRTFELQGIAPDLAKALIWRYLLAVQVARHLVEHARAAHPKPHLASVAALRKFLVANGELDDQRPKFWQVVQKLKSSVSLEAFGVKAAVEVGAPSEGIRTANQLDVIERNVGKAIADLACPDDHPRLLVLVDQIEDVWSNDIESERLVIGLLRAARDVSATFRRVECVVFLRNDIHELLQFADKDKFRGEELHVDWSADRLLELALVRARASLGEPIDHEDLWGRIFPAQVDGVDTETLVVSHTLRRPRDMIHLCNVCRDTAKQNGHTTIRVSDVREAINRYSKWKLDDLPNEYLVNYPYLGGLLAMFRDSGYLVGRGAFEKRFKASLEDLRGRFPDRAYALTPNAVLDVLYHVGFLGVHRNGHVVYSHEEEDRVEPTDEAFCIHPSFRHALRADAPTLTQPTEWYVGNVRLGVGNAAQNAGGAPYQRADVSYELLGTASAQAYRLLKELPRSGLPKEIRDEILDKLTDVLDRTRRLTDSFPDTGQSVRHTVAVADLFTSLSRTLDEGGFTDKEPARVFVRTLGELGGRLHGEAAGVARR